MKYSYMFVYGTLRKTGGNEFYLANSEYVGTGKTKEFFSLYVEGIPYLNSKENNYNVIGEVYRVNETTLASVDMLEGHPRWYYRFPTEIVLEDGQVILAWTYFNNQKTKTKLEEGDYIKYINKNNDDTNRLLSKV